MLGLLCTLILNSAANVDLSVRRYRQWKEPEHVILQDRTAALVKVSRRAILKKKYFLFLCSLLFVIM